MTFLDLTDEQGWSVIEPDSGFAFLHRFLGEQIARLGGAVTEGEPQVRPVKAQGTSRSDSESASASPSVTVLADYRDRRNA